MKLAADLCVRLVVAVLKVAAIWSFADQATAQEGLTASMLAAPTLTAEVGDSGVHQRWEVMEGATQTPPVKSEVSCVSRGAAHGREAFSLPGDF